ncbi:unnamed protein product [Eruca vesicaria subsp. sativa]|uniref:GRF-type domain-containing protein n=1 Tax=Eruca vesicaria subsp. sativa TaxID=29727 RepID=A0ABC8KQ96_ERUVS|nr:unnamed protein product [Eruca vesicaria subsp. sativa]
MSESVNFQSVYSQSAISSSSDDNGVLCDCKRKAKVVRAWTRENPGRRFYGCSGYRVGNGCESCNFFRWYDVEKPHGWQHLALQEARDIIREQKAEIANLRTKKEKDEQCEALKREVLILNERSYVLRNVLVASAVGFGVAVGGIMVMSKW